MRATSYTARPRTARTVSQTVKINKAIDYEKDGDGVLTGEQVRNYRDDWDRLVTSANGISYQQAVLLKTIRDHYPAGPSGLLQYRKILRNVFHVTAGKSLVAISFVGGKHRLTEQDWKMYGGLIGLMHIFNLPGQGPAKVRAALKARIENNDRPLSYSIIRNVALQMGYRSASNSGRPTQTESEEKVATLRNFIVASYKAGKLPGKLPANVAAAMSKSALETIREVLSN